MTRVACPAQKALAESSSKVIEAQAKATSLCQERQLLESRLNELLEKRDEVRRCPQLLFLLALAVVVACFYPLGVPPALIFSSAVYHHAAGSWISRPF